MSIVVQTSAPRFFASAIATLLVGLLAAGCGGSCKDLAEAGPWLEVGAGEDSFAEVADGDVLPAAWGSQGGQHIWGAAEAGNVRFGAPEGPTGPGESNPRIGFTIGDEDGVVASTGPSQRSFTRAAGTGHVAGVSIFVQVSPWDTPWLFPDDYDPNDTHTWEEEEAAWEVALADLEGRDLVLRATLEDSCGSEVSDERTVRLSGVELGY